MENDREPDDLLVGWQQIGDYFKVSVTTIRKRKIDLLKAGAVFQQYRNDRNKNQRMKYCAFPQELRRWIAKKTQRGEIF